MCNFFLISWLNTFLDSLYIHDENTPFNCIDYAMIFSNVCKTVKVIAVNMSPRRILLVENNHSTWLFSSSSDI